MAANHLHRNLNTDIVYIFCSTTDSTNIFNCFIDNWFDKEMFFVYIYIIVDNHKLLSYIWYNSKNSTLFFNTLCGSQSLFGNCYLWSSHDANVSSSMWGPILWQSMTGQGTTTWLGSQHIIRRGPCWISKRKYIGMHITECNHPRNHESAIENLLVKQTVRFDISRYP